MDLSRWILTPKEILLTINQIYKIYSWTGKKACYSCKLFELGRATAEKTFIMKRREGKLNHGSKSLKYPLKPKQLKTGEIIFLLAQIPYIEIENQYY